MKKLIIGSVIIFITFILAVVFLLSYQKPVQENFPSAPLPTASLTPKTSSLKPKAVFSLDEPKTVASKGATVKVDIILQATGTALASDLDINYDPQVLKLKEIQPGGFFSSPMEFSKDVSESTGKIFYALGSVTPSSLPKKEVVARLFFESLGVGPTQVRLGDKTMVSFKEIEKAEIVLPGK